MGGAADDEDAAAEEITLSGLGGPQDEQQFAHLDQHPE